MKNDNIIRTIRKVLQSNIGLTLFLLIMIIGVVVASLVPPQLLKYIVDDILPAKDAGRLLTFGLVYMAVLLFIGLFDFIKEALITILGQKITKEIRVEMMKKMADINAMFFSQNGSGAIVSRFTNDVDAISSLFSSGIIGMMIDCLKVIGIVVSIWIFSMDLGILTLLLLPVIYGITRLFQKKMLKAQIENRIIVGKVNNHLSESLKNIRMIKSFSKEKYMESRFVGLLDDNYDTVEKVNFYDSVFSPIIQIMRATVIGAIVILASGGLSIFSLTVGTVVASIELITNLFTPIENLGMELQSIQQAVSGLARVRDFFREPVDQPKNKRFTKEFVICEAYDVTMSINDVSFRYDEDTDVLHHISLKLDTHESVTFVGRTGVGKTTLFKLVMGLLKPTSGSITINGIDVYDIPNKEKRRIFGYVDQSMHFIKGTVADQISLQDKRITREEIQNALEYVGLDEYVATLENGMDTVITKDNLFSQGQKQLLAIARAIVTNPMILLLDEITSNLDSLTEKKIISVLKKAKYRCIVLSISHRLSSMIASDKVVILENGSIRSIGSPETLLENDEWYRSHVALEKLTWN